MLKRRLVHMHQFVGNTYHIHSVYIISVYNYFRWVRRCCFMDKGHRQPWKTEGEISQEAGRRKQQSPKLPSVVCLLSGVFDSVSMTSHVVEGTITSCSIASLCQSLATCVRNFCGPSFQTRERCSHHACLRLTNCLSRHYCSCLQHNHDHNQLVFPH